VTIIVPAVGRIVWYWPSPVSKRPIVNNQPFAAQITAVHNDRCVNLSICDANGQHFALTSVPLHQEGDIRQSWAFAEWMPYQKALAARREAEEAEAEQPLICPAEQGPIHLVQAPNIIINAHSVFLERD
jgi:hypothetical protein